MIANVTKWICVKFLHISPPKLSGGHTGIKLTKRVDFFQLSSLIDVDAQNVHNVQVY